MFVANHIDGHLSLIRYVGTPGPSVPVRHAVTVVPKASSYRTKPGRLATFAGLARAASVSRLGAGRATAATPVGPAAPLG
jgi:hypothetical protein